MKINNALSAAAKKATSIITMASMLSSMLNLGLILPVKAQNYQEAAYWADAGGYVGNTSTLAAVTSFISSPFPSSCLQAGQCDEYTNISYNFTLTESLTLPNTAPTGKIKIATNTQGPNVEARERWNSLWVASFNASTDAELNFNGEPTAADISITAAVIADGNGDLEDNTLELTLTCDTAPNASPNGCIIPAGVEYTLDLKNNPLITPNIAWPVRQNFIIVNDDNLGEAKMVINSYNSGLTVSASVDARLTFLVTGENAGATLGTLTSTDNSSSSGCDFGTLLPNTPEICIWTLNGSTNAANGMQVYVVQDQNMTYPGSGQSIRQFFDGNQTLYSAAPQIGWSSPSTADAHLGYTSDDADVFDAVALGEQPFAGITNMKGASYSATEANTAKVADTNTAGELSAKYANKIETTTRLEQAPASLGQSYGHTQYFVVVGNF